MRFRERVQRIRDWAVGPGGWLMDSDRDEEYARINQELDQATWPSKTDVYRLEGTNGFGYVLHDQWGWATHTIKGDDPQTRHYTDFYDALIAVEHEIDGKASDWKGLP